MRVGRGFGGQGWTASSSVDPPACDFRSSSKLVFLHCSTMASGTSVISWSMLTWVEGRGLGVVIEDSARFG